MHALDGTLALGPVLEPDEGREPTFWPAPAKLNPATVKAESMFSASFSRK
jgi:hypothetical protein